MLGEIIEDGLLDSFILGVTVEIMAPGLFAGRVARNKVDVMIEFRTGHLLLLRATRRRGGRGGAGGRGGDVEECHRWRRKRREEERRGRRR